MATAFHDPHPIHSIKFGDVELSDMASQICVTHSRDVYRRPTFEPTFLSTVTSAEEPVLSNLYVQDVVQTTLELTVSTESNPEMLRFINSPQDVTVNGANFRITNLELGMDYGEVGRHFNITLTGVGAVSEFNIDVDMEPLHGRRRRALQVTDGPEAKARLLLKRLIGDTAFRNYLKHGFVSYRGKSGKTYQIFPGEGMTNVWENGKPMEKLCVIFNDGKCPPTDAVVMRLLLLENSEGEFKRLSNSFGLRPSMGHQQPQVVETGRILKLAERKARGEIMVQGSRIIVAA